MNEVFSWTAYVTVTMMDSDGCDGCGICNSRLLSKRSSFNYPSDPSKIDAHLLAESRVVQTSQSSWDDNRYFQPRQRRVAVVRRGRSGRAKGWSLRDEAALRQACLRCIANPIAGGFVTICFVRRCQVAQARTSPISILVQSLV
jgi:hypothetical protein